MAARCIIRLNTLKGAFYARLERALMDARTCSCSKARLRATPISASSARRKGVVHCVFNGVTPDEFEPVSIADDATDLVYVGEFRHIKGADLLVDAVARLHEGGKKVTLTLGGDGEETAALKAQVEQARPRQRHPLHRSRQGALRLLQGAAAGRALARRFHALCRDRGWRLPAFP